MKLTKSQKIIEFLMKYWFTKIFILMPFLLLLGLLSMFGARKGMNRKIDSKMPDNIDTVTKKLEEEFKDKKSN